MGDARRCAARGRLLPILQKAAMVSRHVLLWSKSAETGGKTCLRIMLAPGKFESSRCMLFVSKLILRLDQLRERRHGQELGQNVLQATSGVGVAGEEGESYRAGSQSGRAAPKARGDGFQ